MTDDSTIPKGTRIRKISAQSGPIPVGALGTIVEPVTANGVPAYIVLFDMLPGKHVLTPAARIEPIASVTPIPHRNPMIRG